MIDRVLNEADLHRIERHIKSQPNLFWTATTAELIVSHRLQAARIQVLETEVRLWREELEEAKPR